MMNNLKKTLAFCFSLHCVACATTVPSTPSVDELMGVGWELEYYNEWFETVLGTFGTKRSNDGPTHNRFTLLIHPTFDELTLIQIEKRPDYKVESAIGVTSLEGYTQVSVSFYDTEYESGPERNSLRYQRAIRNTFVIDVSDEEFDAVFAEMESVELSRMPNFYPINGCTDGTRMFAEIQKGDGRKFVTRHDCDETYNEDFSAFEPLFEFAGHKIPSLQSKLAAVWKTETSRNLDAK